MIFEDFFLFLPFSLRRTVTIFKDIFYFPTFFRNNRNAFRGHISLFSSRTVTIFEDIFHFFTFFQKDHNSFWGYFSLFYFFSSRTVMRFKDIFHFR